MNKHSDSMVLQIFAAGTRRFVSLAMLPLALIAAGMLTGCKTQSFSPTDVLKEQAAAASELTRTNSELLKLQEGDVLKISFPSSPTFDTTQQIRHDGRITMSLVGDIDVVGLTPSELEKKLVDLYAAQLSSKLVTVEVVSSSIPIYVTGMVLRPGKILSNHPITALGAVMEAGGFDYNTADPKDVVVTRREGNIMKNYKLNLKAVLQGKQDEPFFLKPYDIVYVPQRFSMF
jgi:polysaccharide export outer membrane protein